MKSNKELFEDLGSLTQQQYNQTPRVSPLGSFPQQKWQGTSPQLQGVQLFNFSFRGWQQQLISGLNGGAHIYCVASPGAGKTSPVVYYWADKLLGLNPRMDLNKLNLQVLYGNISKIITQPEKLPQILYLCPVRALVYEVQKDFRNYFGQMLTHLFTIMIHKTNEELGIIQPGITNRPAIPELTNLLRQDPIIPKLTNLLRRHLNINLKEYFDRRNELNEQLRSNDNQNIARRIANDMNIIDQQIQELISKRLINFIDTNLVNITTELDKKKTPNNVPVTIAIYESGATRIFKNLHQDNLKLLIIDEAHYTQTMKNEEERVEKITKALYSMFKILGPNSNKTQIVLLSGTVHPGSANNLLTYIRNCFKIDIKMLQSGNEARNPSSVSVLPMNELQNEQTLIKLLLTPKESNNIIIMFSKEKINNLVDEALKKSKGLKHSAQDINKGVLQTQTSSQYGIDLKELEKNDPKNISEKYKYDVPDLMKKINTLPGASEISDERLLLAVLSGFGWIYRPDDKMSRGNQKAALKDTQIIAHLFSTGKIKTIIATDAVGIGVNLTIKNMYIPNIKKFDGISFGTSPISKSSQLYNRVGRMAFEASTIYTPEEYVNNVIMAISARNEKFEQGETMIKKHWIWNKMACNPHTFSYYLERFRGRDISYSQHPMSFPSM
jgi:hypothetical protein